MQAFCESVGQESYCFYRLNPDFLILFNRFAAGVRVEIFLSRAVGYPIFVA